MKNKHFNYARASFLPSKAIKPWASHWSAKGPLKSHLAAPGISNCALVHVKRSLFMKTSVSPAWEHHLEPPTTEKSTLGSAQGLLLEKPVFKKNEH